VGFRLVTLNLNGVRSAASKGFLAYAEQVGADCMCVQEVKAQHADIAGRFERIGVGSRKREFDAKGRCVEQITPPLHW